MPGPFILSIYCTPLSARVNIEKCSPEACGNVHFPLTICISFARMPEKLFPSVRLTVVIESVWKEHPFVVHTTNLIYGNLKIYIFFFLFKVTCIFCLSFPDPVSYYNPLHIAVLRNKPGMVKLLLDHGAHIERRDRVNKLSLTPLC